MKLLNKLKYDLSKYNKLELLTTLISAALLIWFVLSFFNIVSNNMSTHTYAKWNIIIILNNYFK
ncbi:MAG TPA: hypothetical protein GXZ90_09915 [Clostridiales bacterium]|nr:hypothetical protein [Clostridiales bacterium]